MKQLTVLPVALGFAFCVSACQEPSKEALRHTHARDAYHGELDHYGEIKKDAPPRGRRVAEGEGGIGVSTEKAAGLDL